MTFEEKTLSEETIYKGKIIDLKRQEVTVKSGTSWREIIVHSGGAVVIAVTGPRKIAMIRQFRKPAEKVMFEVPAGKIDPGEEPVDAAIRELKEETGFTASSVRYLTRFYPTVGYSREVLYLYLMEGLTPGDTDFDENEAIDMEEWSIDDLHEMVMRGEIDDAKTIIAIEYANILVK